MPEFDERTLTSELCGATVEAAALMKRFERLKARLAKLAAERGLLE
jgi:hypothetical protein